MSDSAEVVHAKEMSSIDINPHKGAGTKGSGVPIVKATSTLDYILAGPAYVMKSSISSPDCLTNPALIFICCIPCAAADVCPGIAIPSYFYPGELWTTSITAAPRVAMMIVNPDSGPGSSKDTNYVNAVRTAQAAGIKVLGYVHTRAGAGRAPAAGRRDARRTRNRIKVLR